MAIPLGARLGPYEILASIGSGGMGDVYRARDTRLKREVAVKVVPAHLTSDSNKRLRFEREAVAVAALSHPNICSLFDVGSQEGVQFLVMEYLEGETLEHRLMSGPLPLEQLMRCAVEIVAALDHAHRHGIVHRDLKPTNIMLTSVGVKLLDFGLAKLSEPEPAALARSTSDQANPLPDTLSLTADGAIVGTLQYMSPEQVEGKAVDVRTDLFAFGAILYEMATRRRAFTGSSQASLIAAILTTDPLPLSSLEPLAPPGLERIVRKCLAKEPEARWQTARDLLDELKWIAEGSQLAVPAPSSKGWRLALHGVKGQVILACVATLVIMTAVWQLAPATSSMVQFAVAPPPGSAFNPAPAFMALSPDGRHLAFSAANRNAGMALWLRSLDSVEVRQLTSEEGAQPFWSPDSRSIGFYAGGQYKRIDIQSGRVQALIDATGQSGTWNREGVIVMKLGDRPVLSRFSINGGPATPATTLDAARGETTHTWPHFLPDGRRFVYVARSAQLKYDKTLYVGSLDSDSRTMLFQTDSNAVYAPPGYLLFMRGSALVAQPFDAVTLRLTGEAVPIADRVDMGPGARAAFSVSNTGVLAYRPIGETRLLWVDRNGRVLDAIGPSGNYGNPALSPDGQRAAVARIDSATGAPDIWLIELASGSQSRLTSDSGAEDMPLWSPDGERIVFRAVRQTGASPQDVSTAGFFDKSSSGDGQEQRVLSDVGSFANPLGWSRRGRALVYARQEDGTLNDVWELPGSGDRTPVALLRSEFQEIQGQPSPDGRWMAYVSNESGRYEVYVRSLTGEGKWPLSAGGGLEPKWRVDGKEIFYLAADRSLMSVTLRDTGSTLEFAAPTRLFETRMSTIPNTGYTRNQYDVSPDGERFLINQPPAEASPAPISVIVNWPAILTR